MHPPSKTLTAAIAALIHLNHVQAYLSNGEVIIPGASSYNGLALTPPMGWDNWNAFGCDVSEDLLLQTARAMVDYGLRDLGYDTVLLDDCWQLGRNSSGYMVENPKTFPRGMKFIADQLHGMGMKFGMYSSAGVYTCARYTASLDNEEKDAAYFAEVGIDYLKYDNCYNQGRSGTPKLSFDRYNAMSRALNATGRPIVYALCNWGDDNPFDWAYTISNAGRMSGDIYDAFSRPDPGCPCATNPCNWPGHSCSVLNILNKMAPIQSRTQSGYFNDMDQLEVGNGGQSDSEYVVHMSMWALEASTMLIGTDVTKLTPADLAIYSNPAVLAVSQDPSATAGSRVWRYECDDVDQYGQCEYALWVRSLDNGDQAVALLNAGNEARTMNASLFDIFYSESHPGTSAPSPKLDKAWDVYDLWANRMGEDEAMGVINGTAPRIMRDSDSKTRWNVTEMSYAEGVRANRTALIGSMVSTVPAQGTLSWEVPRHSVGFFRLREVNGTDTGGKDEL